MNSNNNKNSSSIGECAQLLLRERICPGGLGCMDPGPVLHCQSSSGWLQGEKGEGGRKWNSAALRMLERIRVTLALEVTQCVSGRVQRRGKTCSLLSVQKSYFRGLMLLPEGDSTECVCASTSCPACCIGGKVIAMVRNEGEWWSDMPSFMDHKLLQLTQYLSHLFLLHLLVFHFISLTL